jgi:hypothetical protein
MARMWNTKKNKAEKRVPIDAAWFEGMAILGKNLTPRNNG